MGGSERRPRSGVWRQRTSIRRNRDVVPAWRLATGLLRPQSGRQCRGEGQGHNLRHRVSPDGAPPRTRAGDRCHHSPAVSIDLEDPARARALRRTRTRRERGGQKGPRAQDDPRTAKSRLSRRTSPGSIEQPGMIGRDFDPGWSWRHEGEGRTTGRFRTSCRESASTSPRPASDLCIQTSDIPGGPAQAWANGHGQATRGRQSTPPTRPEAP